MQPIPALSVRSRFHDLCDGRLPPDRLPMLEWAPWWDQTLARWQREGLDPALDMAGLKRRFGLDVDHQYWVWQIPEGTKPQAGAGWSGSGHGAEAWICDADGYEALRPQIYQPSTVAATVAQPYWREWAAEQAAGHALIRLSLEGFFWWPRRLLGIERHLYAFGDQAELLERINQDQADFMLRAIEQVCTAFTPDFITIAEDMSYNHGPMLSKRMFDRFLAPYYRQVVPALKARGIRVFVDSDGDVTQLLPWLKDVGVEGILPLERQAGCDIDALQAAHPEFCFLGHFNKLTMSKGEAAMRSEFERLLPAMRRGRFIPSVDHQTPPEVSLEQYGIYARLFREYAERACTEKAADTRVMVTVCGINV
jgi:hypothetical protein